VAALARVLRGRVRAYTAGLTYWALYRRFSVQTVKPHPVFLVYTSRMALPPRSIPSYF